MTEITPAPDQLLRVATARLEAELRDCRSEASCECSEPLRSWFEGRTQGLEDALRVLEHALQPTYQQRAECWTLLDHGSATLREH